MTGGKKKSSGWRPADKRRPWEETKKLKLIEQHAHFAAASDRQGLWRSCPAALCKRQRRCAVDPYRCTKERGNKTASGAAKPKETPKERPVEQEAPRFAISAKDAAAFIKADVEAHIAATGNDPDGICRG